MEEQFQPNIPKENNINDLLSDPIDQELDNYAASDTSAPDFSKSNVSNKIETTVIKRKSDLMFYIVLGIIIVFGVLGIIVLI